MQLSVPRYAAIAPGRGANLDLIDRPITNAAWLRNALRADSRAWRKKPTALAAIDQILELDQPRPRRLL